MHPLMMFFVNKPKTFKNYIWGFFSILCFCTILYGFIDTFISSLFILMTYTILYQIYLVWSYFIKNADDTLKIKNISLASLRGCFIRLFKITRVVLILTFVLTLPFVWVFWRSDKSVGILCMASFLLLIYTFISCGIFLGIIKTKLTSMGIKNNAEFNASSLEEIYADARELLMKKLID